MVFEGVRRDVFGGMHMSPFWREVDKGAGGSAASAPTGDGSGSDASTSSPTEEVDFDAWQAEWSPAQKTAFSVYEHGLKSALEKERNAKSEMEKQLRSLSKKTEGQADVQQQLQSMADALKEATEEASFMREAAGPQVRCTHAKLAWLAAKEDGLIDADGKTDWDGLKKGYPQLFLSKIPDANAGEGGSGGKKPGNTMDDLLRNR